MYKNCTQNAGLIKPQFLHLFAPKCYTRFIFMDPLITLVLYTAPHTLHLVPHARIPSESSSDFQDTPSIFRRPRLREGICRQRHGQTWSYTNTNGGVCTCKPTDIPTHQTQMHDMHHMTSNKRVVSPFFI